MDDSSLQKVENFGIELFELVVSYARTLVHLAVKPRVVFGSIGRRAGLDGTHSQEVYGDGVVGYTSPVLFVTVSLVLQLVAVWSATFYHSSAGSSESQLSLGGLAVATQFLVFAAIAALMADAALRATGSAGNLRGAFHASCYAGGFGVFRGILQTAAQWFLFAGSAARGRDPGLLLDTGWVLAGLALVLLAWQLVLFVVGFTWALGLPRRTASWVMAKAVTVMVPLGVFLVLLFSAPEVVFVSRVVAMEASLASGRPDLALHHAEYLSTVEGFERTKAAVELRRVQLEGLVYRRWLPAYVSLRQDLETLRGRLETPGRALSSCVVDLAILRDRIRPGRLAALPPAELPEAGDLDDLVARQAGRMLPALTGPAPQEDWPLPYPSHVGALLDGCLAAAAAGQGQVLDERLTYALLCVDGGILAMARRLRTLREDLVVRVAAVEPAYGFRDAVAGLVTGVWSVRVGRGW